MDFQIKRERKIYSNGMLNELYQKKAMKKGKTQRMIEGEMKEEQEEG